MKVRRKHQKSSEAGARRQSQIELIVVILSINDGLIKKHLFIHSKFIAGKSQQCQIETDFRPVLQTLVGQPPNSVSSLHSRLLIHFGEKKHLY